MPIFDQGYQHWNGELSGHGWRWYAIARHGVRIGMKSWILRIAIILAWLPAVGLALAVCVWGLVEQKSALAAFFLPILTDLFGPEVLADPKKYRVEIWSIFYEFFLRMEMRYSMIVVMIVGPSLISRDLRFNALPLYFSRPMRRIDYFVGKLGVIGWFLAMALVFPSVIAYVLGLLFSLDITIIWDTASVLLASIGYGLIMALSAGTFILAMSSLTRNSRYVALLWVGIWFVSAIAGEAVEGAHQAQRQRARFEHMYATRSVPQQSAKPLTRDEQIKQMNAQREAERQYWAQVEADELEEAKRDWRPMLSYTANLSRVGQGMLRTNDRWERLSELQPADQRTQFKLRSFGPGYPWYWSAAWLAVLFGISACILNFRVKSLDRLK